MDPEVIEVPPPVHRSLKSKNKQVVEIIDVDKDEDSVDIMILDDVVNARNKGKAVKSSSGAYSTIQAEDFVAKSLSSNNIEPSNHATQGSHKIVNLDCDLFYDDESFDNYYLDEFMDVDDYAMLQAHFDSVDLPAGVEAPIPWFPKFSESKEKTSHRNVSSSVAGSDQALSSSWLSEPGHINKKPASVSSSSFQTPGDPLSSPGGASLSSPLLFPHGSQSNNIKMSAPSQHSWNGQNLPFGHSLQSSQAGGSTNGSHVNHSDAVTVPNAFNPTYWNDFGPASASSSGFHLNMPTPLHSLNHTMVPVPTMSWSAAPSIKPNFHFKMHNTYSNFPDPVGGALMKPKFNVKKHNIYSNFGDPVDGAYVTPQELAEIRNQRIVKEDDVLNKLQNFKKFDTVENFTDHHYSSSGSSTNQPQKNWAKKIQEEWRILEKDLPDTIFVRVCESRMDLLRAVIIGAEGTPYHDGLFFFDVFFPASYPKVPPLVYYHSGGLRLNPNLYNCGKVCLSLLGTWSGKKNEKWIPGMSTMLQVLVSIQALILNQKPYFNEPGWECQSGTPRGEIASHKYNENTFILSLRTMIYSMRKPPKHFEDFVVGHFYKRAQDILVACKAYMDGAQVGCLVKGGVQDVDEGDKSCSQGFKDSLAGCVNMLVKEFTVLGAKDCEKFLTAPAPKGQKNHRVNNMPKAAI
ncbi:Ubiquitin-conjugating enzyme, E2 [Corchorus olitorius]|uniref:E2 ubiquitin-conjugating enzyme n=1 Tax=Corchorus olitorius TaxID=93759 RepID=A0A1R3HT26_9ROSI|nr:Ubiquitin-conjugating enzyme, E2 [Corchorus olitorius]